MQLLLDSQQYSIANQMLVLLLLHHQFNMPPFCCPSFAFWLLSQYLDALYLQCGYTFVTCSPCNLCDVSILLGLRLGSYKPRPVYQSMMAPGSLNSSCSSPFPLLPPSFPSGFSLAPRSLLFHSRLSFTFILFAASVFRHCNGRLCTL